MINFMIVSSLELSHIAFIDLMHAICNRSMSAIFISVANLINLVFCYCRSRSLMLNGSCTGLSEFGMTTVLRMGLGFVLRRGIRRLSFILGISYVFKENQG